MNSMACVWIASTSTSPTAPSAAQAYMADITYGTNNEFGFDYLRDNMAHAPNALVQRKHHFAIVDEVDSVLIDDARTPLIISGPTPKGDVHQFDEYKPRVERLYDAQRQLVTKLLTEAKEASRDRTMAPRPRSNWSDGGMALLRAYRGLAEEQRTDQIPERTRCPCASAEDRELLPAGPGQGDAQGGCRSCISPSTRSTTRIELTEKGIDLISGDVRGPNCSSSCRMWAHRSRRSRRAGHPRRRRPRRRMSSCGTSASRANASTPCNQLIRAYALFEKDVEYVVMDGKVKIVDEQTGRIMEGRRYSDGLHQAIESKEKVKVEAATQTYATVTLQNYFRMYHKLAGMTGTAETEAQEFWDIYKLDVMVIPTNRPIVARTMTRTWSSRPSARSTMP